MPGVPGPLTFSGVVANAARLYGRKPLPLIGSFLIVYAAAVGMSFALDPLDDGAATAAALGIRVLVAVLGAFASAYTAVILADVVAGRTTTRPTAGATLRVHAAGLIASGLLAALIGFPFDYILPLMWVTIIGPPLVVHVVVLEYRPFRESLRRVGTLLAGQWGRVSLIVLGLALAVLLGFYLFRIYGLPFVAPFFSAATLVLYLDVRARAEELDFPTFAQERANAMGEPVAVDPTPD